MKRVNITTVFTYDVPDDVSPEDISLSIPEDTFKDIGLEQFSGKKWEVIPTNDFKMVGYETIDVEEIEDVG